MKHRSFLIYTSLLIVLAVAGAIVHGRLTDRWGGDAAELQAAAETLQLAPRSFGNWELQSEEEFSDRVKGILNCAGSWNRKYVNRTTQQVVSVAMIVGPPGPTSSHFAGLCYNTQGFKAVSEGSRFQLESTDGNKHEFFEDNFVSPGVSGQRLQVCYSWRQIDRWWVPTIPRVAFGSHPVLYKLQVAADHYAKAAQPENSSCKMFLQEFLPALEQTVFGQSNSR